MLCIPDISQCIQAARHIVHECQFCNLCYYIDNNAYKKNACDSTEHLNLVLNGFSQEYLKQKKIVMAVKKHPMAK